MGIKVRSLKMWRLFLKHIHDHQTRNCILSWSCKALAVWMQGLTDYHLHILSRLILSIVALIRQLVLQWIVQIRHVYPSSKVMRLVGSLKNGNGCLNMKGYALFHRIKAWWATWYKWSCKQPLVHKNIMKHNHVGRMNKIVSFESHTDQEWTTYKFQDGRGLFTHIWWFNRGRSGPVRF